MSADDQKGVKVFPYYNNLLPELRELVVKKMRPDDRCRYSGTSNRCNYESKTSKNYLYELKLNVQSRFDVRIQVIYGPYKDKEEPRHGCVYLFERRNNRNYLKCLTLGDIRLWIKELDGRLSNLDYGLERFATKLKLYKHAVKKIVFDGDMFDNDRIFWRGINFTLNFPMKNLTILELPNADHFAEIVSRVQHPLKEIVVRDTWEEFFQTRQNNLAARPEIYRAQDMFISLATRLNNEQFLRLVAPHVHIHIGELTEQNIYSFIRSWQNGTIGREVQCYYWSLTDSEFDTNRLLRMLGADGESDDPVPIQHLVEAGKTAKLMHQQNHRLQFTVNQ